jgi:hypothetical protein
MDQSITVNRPQHFAYCQSTTALFALTYAILRTCYAIASLYHRQQCILVGDSNKFKHNDAGALLKSLVEHYYTKGARQL